MNFYKENLKVEIDQSGKDITRLCFMSHDPEAYFNENNAIFNIPNKNDNSVDGIQGIDQTAAQVPESVTDLSVEESNLSGSYQDAFGVCVMQTNAKLEFKKGNRNNYIYQLGVNCIHAGIPLEVAVNESKKVFDLNKMEIERTIKSAYTWKPASSPDIPVKGPVELPREISMAIPERIFDRLPSLLKRACKTARPGRERDVFLTAAFGVLSGCLNNLTGVYDGDIYHPNLFVFVVARAASGKGAMKYARALGTAYHNELRASNEQKRIEYEKDSMIYQNECAKFKKGKIEEPPTAPEQPVYRKLFISANISSAMLIHRLKRNGESGILFDSEADTMGNNLKQDWGDLSPLLRKAFHHEEIGLERKSTSDAVDIEIDFPRLSLVLSGTPDQVTNLVPSPKNGLFSRFIFYTFEERAKWRDVSRKSRVANFQNYYKDLSKEVLKIIHFFENHETDFDLADHQWKELNSTFEKILEETGEDYGDETDSMAKRHGIICFRLAMILSGIRKAEENNQEHILICRDDDFEVAISLTKIYHQHALLMYEGLPQSNNTGYCPRYKKMELFLNALPDNFMRKEADALCPKFNMVSRSGGRYLQALIKEGWLRRSATGRYGEYFKTGKV